MKIKLVEVYYSEPYHGRAPMIGQRGPNLVISFLKVKAKRKTGLMFKNDAFREINTPIAL